VNKSTIIQVLMKKLFSLVISVMVVLFSSCKPDLSDTLGKVETGAVSDVTPESVILHGVVNVDISKYDIVTYGMMVSDSKEEMDNHAGKMYKANVLFTKNFELSIEDLSPETKYYYCAWLFLNNMQYEFGEIKEFETEALVVNLPTITTTLPTDVSFTSAIVGGKVTDDGGTTIIERGVVYSTSPRPTTSDLKVKNGSGIGSYVCSLSNLQNHKHYYVRAYATNKKGTAYGEQFSFWTKAYNLPTVTTLPATNILSTSATVGGEVTDDGGTTVTVCGVVYSISPSPTIYNSIEIGGSGLGSYVCSLSNLQAGRYYYVRAFAKNEVGVVYGEEISFTTNSAVTPSVSTLSATNITSTSATVEGEVTNDGGAVITERGVVYSTSPNPTILDSKVTSGDGSFNPGSNDDSPPGGTDEDVEVPSTPHIPLGGNTGDSGMGSFSCSLKNLKAGTTYYVRAYAINEKGTAYGDQISFTTIIANAFSVSGSKQVTFSKGNLQYHPANNKWRFAESQLDYIGYDNENISSSYNGWLDLFGWSTSATNYGVSTSISSSDYSGSFVDWGANKIGNDAPNTWRTLTWYEWYYLLEIRTNASSLCGVAQVDGVNGMVFLPDNWTCPTGVSFKSGFHSSDGVDYYADYQTFTAAEWSKLESAGAVFLPAAGYCYGSNVRNVQGYGYYWSATEKDSSRAYIYYFTSHEAFPSNSLYLYGLSVRLVKDL
jgi:hypothetical protein